MNIIVREVFIKRPFDQVAKLRRLETIHTPNVKVKCGCVLESVNTSVGAARNIQKRPKLGDYVLMLFAELLQPVEDLIVNGHFCVYLLGRTTIIFFGEISISSIIQDFLFAKVQIRR